MKICWLLIVTLSCPSLSILGDTLGDENIVKDLRFALENMEKVKKGIIATSFPEYFQYESALKIAYTQVVMHAFSDPNYDRPDSFLATVLRTPDIVKPLISQICIMRFSKTPDNADRSRFCNFMIQTLYTNRTTNTNACDAIKSILYFNDYPEVYSSETREIVKKLILENRIHFFYADVVGLIKDKEIQDYLLPIANREGRHKDESFNRVWLATCVLAKAGDKTAHKKMESEADNLRNLHKAMSVPLGMAYLGDREMVLRLLEMLKSDLKKRNGEDVIPKETQLSHEAAAVLSLCVKGFLNISSFQTYSAQDKARCLKWAEEHKENIVFENKTPLYYLKNTYFSAMMHR